MLLRLSKGRRFGLVDLRNEETRQDATVLRNGLDEGLRRTRGSIE
jgi:hypothetical protein